MSKQKYSMATGRKRQLKFRVLGSSFTIDAHERIEVTDLVTGERLPVKAWWMPGVGCRVPLGCTCRYFEMRKDTNERIRSYEGLVSVRVLK